MTSPEAREQPLFSVRCRRGGLVAVSLFLLASCAAGDHSADGQARANPGAPVGAEPRQPPGGEVAPGPDAAPALEIRSQPTGATVFLNGRLAGATPLALTGLPPGLYSVRLEKDGCAPQAVSATLANQPVRLDVPLPVFPVGTLVVDVEPHGAEVLLDGHTVGLSPVKLDQVPAGAHELVIRMTNFRPFTDLLVLRPGQTLRYADAGPDNRLLKDRILEMLEGRITAEPHRVANYIDKGHYLFLNGRMNEAAEAFVRAREVAGKPLVRPPNVSDEDWAAEERLRMDDRRRLHREIEKHCNPRFYPEKNAIEFARILETASAAREHENIGDWAWVEFNGRQFVQSGQLTRAEELFEGHLQRAGGGPSGWPCGLELLKVRISLRDLADAENTFIKLYGWAKDRPDRMLELAQTAYRYADRVRATDRDTVLAMAEKAARQAYESTRAKDLRADCAFELANVLKVRSHPAESLAYYKEALTGARTPEAGEERSLALADALRLAGQPAEARGVYEQLSKSPNAATRERAKAGLLLLAREKG